MPQIEQVKSQRGRNIIIAVVSVLVVIGLIGYLLWRIFPTATDTVKKSDELNAQRRYAQAETLLNSAYHRALTKGDKALVLSRLASTAANRGKLPEALKYYEELNTLQPGQYSTLMSMGDVAERLKRKDAALKAYRDALAVIEKAPNQDENPRHQAEINGLKARIKDLESRS